MYKYWDVNNMHGWAISQKLPIVLVVLNGLKKHLKKAIVKIFIQNILLKLMFSIRICMNFIIIYHLTERMKIGKVEKLLVGLYDDEKLYPKEI